MSCSLSSTDLASPCSHSTKDISWVQPLGVDNLSKMYEKSSETSSIDGSITSPDVMEIRRQVEKRKRSLAHRPMQSDTICISKGTLAGRRYREKRKAEVELLAQKVRDLEQELATAKVEKKWWQMEASRWKELAQNGMKR